jgi:hypothetical protein
MPAIFWVRVWGWSAAWANVRQDARRHTTGRWRRWRRDKENLSGCRIPEMAKKTIESLEVHGSMLLAATEIQQV